MRIDSHQHFWHYNATDYAWIDDSMKAIQRDFLPSDLELILQKHKFDGCVLVQVNQTEAENEYFLKFAELYDFIKAVVGWVDLKSENLGERLEFYRQFKLIKGFRHIVQGEPVGFMRDEQFINGIQQLAPHNYTYDILIYPNQMKDAVHLIRQCPDNQFVTDHIAKPYIKDKEIVRWANYMQKLSEFPHVMCKISGMVTEADWQNWKKEDFYIYLDVIFECFGTDRIMYGSDWPVCLVAAQYEEQLGIVESYFDKLSSTEKAKIFGENAAKFYHIA